MPSTAAEQRTRRLAAASDRRRRGRTVTKIVQQAARREASSLCHDGIDGADDSDSDGAFAAEPNDGARSPLASPGGGSRSDSDNSNDGPGAAVPDYASHELSNTDAAACSADYGHAVLRHCQRALQLLHDGGVRESTAGAAAPDARAFPLSDLIPLARAAACSAPVPRLPTAARVRQACSLAGVQAVDVIVEALSGIRSAVDLRRRLDRRRQSQRAKPGRNDAAAALDQLYATDWSDLLADADYLDRSDAHAVQQLADKIRSAGHVTAEDVKSCVENFRVDDDMILKVRDVVSFARHKLLPRGCALMTPRGRAGRLAACARARAVARCASREDVPAVRLHSRAFHVRAAHVRARFMCTRRTFALALQVCGACSRRDPGKTYSECVLGHTSPAWMRVSQRGLAQLNDEGVVQLLDNDGNTVPFHTKLLRHFVEFHGHTYHCHRDAVDLDTGACDLCSDCVRVGRPTLGHALRAGRPHPCERLDAYYSGDAPEGSIAAGDDIGTLEALEDFSVATDVSQLEVLLLARARAYAIINKVTA